MTEHYTIKADKFNKLRIQTLLKKILRLVLILLTVSAIGYFNLNSDKPLSDLSLMVVQIIPLFTIFILIVFVIDVAISLYRHEKVLKSFKLTTTEHELRQEMQGWPTVRIDLEKIRLITKDKQDNIIVRGATSLGIAIIPAEINNYEQLEKYLAQIMKTEPENEFLSYQMQKILTSIFFFGGLVFVFSPLNKWLAILVGLILSIFLLWKFIDIKKDKNVSSAVRLKSYLMLPALLIIIVATFSNLASGIK